VHPNHEAQAAETKNTCQSRVREAFVRTIFSSLPAARAPTPRFGSLPASRRSVDRVTALLVLALVGTSACSRTEEQPPGPSAVEAMHAKFEGQAVAILPFEPTNPACAADPYTMDRATLSTCAGLDPNKLPADFQITKDPRDFDLRVDSPVVLVLRGDPADPEHPEIRWHAVIPLGPTKAPTTSLTGASSLHPSFLPLLVIGAVVGGEELIAGGSILFASGVAYFGGKAYFTSQKYASRGQAIAQGDQKAADLAMQSSHVLDDAQKEAQADKASKAVNTTDGGWMASASCVDSGWAAKASAGWGYGATEEEAKNNALDKAGNLAGFPPRARWDDQEYCLVTLVCQRTSGLLDCKDVELL
jgi:hypothetical protein